MKNNEMGHVHYGGRGVMEVHKRFLWGNLVKNRPPER